MNGLKESIQKIKPCYLVVGFGILFYEFLEHLIPVFHVFFEMASVLMPFLFGVAFAWLLDIPVRKLENTKVMKRGLAIAIVVILTGLFIILLYKMIIPRMISSFYGFMPRIITCLENGRTFLEQIPYVNTLDIVKNKTWSGGNVEQIGWKLLSRYGKNLFFCGIEFGNYLVEMITAVVFSIYLLLEKEHLLYQLHLLLRAFLSVKWRDRLFHMYELTNRMMRGFLIGKLIDSIVIGILTAVMMMVFQIPFVSVISVIVGITNMVPIFGPIAGAIIGGILVLLAEPVKCILFLVLIFIIQQLDGHFIGPAILGDTIGLSTAWTLFAIIVGGKIFGFVGMILGVPVFAVLYTLFGEYVYRSVNEKSIVKAEEKECKKA